MPARAPLDVDLEDKLLYGLTPMRLGYVVLAMLGGFALWSSRWAAAPIRAAACLVVIGAGATFAWGRWQGRHLDGWLVDAAAFTTRTQRVVWNEKWVDHVKGRRWLFGSAGSPSRGVGSRDDPIVSGDAPREGDESSEEAAGLAVGVAFPDAAAATG